MLFEITSTLSTMAADEGVYEAARDAGSDEIKGGIAKGKTGTTYVVKWGGASGTDTLVNDDGDAVKTGVDAIDSYCAKVLTNGLPDSQTGSGFTMEIALVSDDGGSPNVYVNCKAN